MRKSYEGLLETLGVSGTQEHGRLVIRLQGEGRIYIADPEATEAPAGVELAEPWFVAIEGNAVHVQVFVDGAAGVVELVGDLASNRGMS